MSQQRIYRCPHVIGRILQVCSIAMLLGEMPLVTGAPLPPGQPLNMGDYGRIQAFLIAEKPGDPADMEFFAAEFSPLLKVGAGDVLLMEPVSAGGGRSDLLRFPPQINPTTNRPFLDSSCSCPFAVGYQFYSDGATFPDKFLDDQYPGVVAATVILIENFLGPTEDFGDNTEYKIRVGEDVNGQPTFVSYNIISDFPVPEPSTGWLGAFG